MLSKLSSLEKLYSNQIGIFYALFSYLLLVISSFFIQNISKHLNSLQIQYFIGFYLFSFNYLTLKLQSKPFCPTKPRTTRMLLLRGFSGFFGSGLTLTGLFYTPLSEAIVLQMTASVITALLAICFCNEKYDITLFLTTMFSFAGVVLISKPEALFGAHQDNAEYPYRTLGIMLTLLGSTAMAVSQILIKKLGTISDAYSTAMYLGIVFVVMAPVFQVYQGIKVPSVVDMVWMLVVGVVRFGMHVMLNKAFAFEDAGKVALMAYSQVPFAYLIDLVIVGVAVDWFSVMGAGCVFSCVFFMLYKNYQKNRIKGMIGAGGQLIGNK